MADRSERDILSALLRVQAEIREIEKDELAYEFEQQNRTQHAKITTSTYRDTESDAVTPTSGASVAPGTDLVLTPTNNAQDVAWADFFKNAETPEFDEPTCVNGTNCLGDNTCFSWWDCDPCDWCENGQCVERDPNRTCQDSSECPCPPNDDQYYICEEGRCALTCRLNEDCPETEVCNPETFTCQPGCESDEECVPGHPNEAPDAQPGTFCVNYTCITPCVPPTYCKGPDDKTTCGEGEYCAEKVVRATTESSYEDTPIIYECVSGCAFTEQCEVEVTEIENGDGTITKYERQPVCIENNCTNACRNDGDCIGDLNEVCVSGACQRQGDPCVSSADCGDGEYCTNGRCESGCETTSDCLRDCDKVKACVDLCPPEPTCSCTDFFTQEECGTSLTEQWQEFCNPDPACVAACPDDPECVAENARGETCVDNTCKLLCPCPNDNYACIDGECVAKTSDPDTICTTEEICEELDNGDIECVIKETCVDVPPSDDRFQGCDCSLTCSGAGQCVPSVCRFDSDCEACSYCADGICVPGCDDENPCGPGQCCQTDGQCHDTCKVDDDCPELETCLEGCCGSPCDPIIDCVSSQSCPDGYFCGVENICEEGCARDEDCSGYDKICVDDGDEVKTCVQRCDTTEDCDDGFYCWESTFCRLDVLACDSDNDCPPLITDYGDVFQQICTNGSCETGCRKDSDCGTSMICYENSCEYVCSNDLECDSLGYGDRCQSNPRAKEAAAEYWNRIQFVSGGTAAEFDRWEFLSRSQDTGFCVDVDLDENGNVVREQRACEGYEQCALNGECERLPCINDIDCPTGNCLSDGLCGLCTQDSDCLDGMVCDFDVECDKNGNNCVTQKEGTCAYPCIPDEDCVVDSDCPKGSYCAEDNYGDRGKAPRKFCAQGCREIVYCDSDNDCPRVEGLNGGEASGRACGPSLCPEGEVCIDGTCQFPINECQNGRCLYNGGECLPGTDCRDGACLKTCESSSDCPLESEECMGGVCVQVGLACSSDSDCPEEVGECYRGRCIEDLRCSKNADCGDDGLCKDGVCQEGDFCLSNADCQAKCETADDCDRRDSTEDPCVSSADCSQSGEFCEDGKCMAAYPTCQGGFCFGDRDPVRCKSNQCVEGEPCNSQADCEFPNICYDGACQFLETCGPGNDCTDPLYYCNNGACVPDLRCSTNGDCLEGFFCNRSGTCQENSDQPRTPSALGCPDDCIQSCSSETFRCEPIVCIVDDDCPCGPCGGDGLCTVGCEDDTDCPAGQVCGADGRCEQCKACEADSDCAADVPCVEGCCDGLPSCRNDSDCDIGVCVKGKCQECRQDRDCEANYGTDDLVCIENRCETPCYTGLSDGSCFDGLKAGDLCENCPEQCPEGYVCGENGYVCGTYEVLNTVTNQAETRSIPCQACIRPCSSDNMCRQRCDIAADCIQQEASGNSCTPGEEDSPCEVGEICVLEGTKGTCQWPAATCPDGVCLGPRLVQEALCGPVVPGTTNRFCEYFDGRCDSDIDCDRVSSLDGVPRTCKDSQCIESNYCVGNSDCDPGQVCVDGKCREGDCTSDIDCGVGYVCSDQNACVYECGPTAEAYTCAAPDGPFDAGKPCPPGYNCNTSTNLCQRPGYEGVGQFMPRCGQGETCIDGGCAACSGNATPDGEEFDDKYDFECRSDVCCADKDPCDPRGVTTFTCSKGKCVEIFRAGYAERYPGEVPKRCDEKDPSDQTPADQPSEEVQDMCEKKGECCGPTGFCVPCACDEENPCPDKEVILANGTRGTVPQCCDPTTGQCMTIDQHPMTKYGAPNKCSFGPVFCEVLGPEGDDGERSVIDVTSYQNELYTGCESYQDADGNMQRRCYPGGPISPSQIATILGQECNPPEEKDCECSVEIPDSDECFQDLDCEGEQRCKSKTFKGDACCPIADENGNDFIVRNVCEGQRSDGTCQSDDDCTDCEYCDGYIPGTPNREGRPGTCKQDCLNRCPDGGELSQAGQRCKTCEEYYGPCVEGITLEETPAFIDPETGEVVDAVTSTTCRIKTETNCCEGITTLEQARRQRDGCLFKRIEVNSQIVIDQVDYCVDFEKDICAECTEDSHCLGSNSKCKKNICITECGDEDSEGYDYVGDCTCCTGEGECKEAFESWSETREGKPGPDGVQSYQTRPCACTKTGIDCGPWTEQNSCYKWFKVSDGSGDEAKAERNRIEEEYNKALDAQEDLDEAASEGNLELSTAAATLTQAKKDQEIICGTTDACDAMVEEYNLSDQTLSDWALRKQNLNAELVDMQNRLAVAKNAVALTSAKVDTYCPDSDLCPSLTQQLANEQEVVRLLEEEEIPAKEGEIEQAQIEYDMAYDEREYWADQVEEQCGYRPSYGQIEEGIESENPLCTQAVAYVEEMQAAYDAAFQNAQKAALEADKNLELVLELERQLNQTIYKKPEWIQQRTCDCCVDGECRDDAECAYGTCYLCQTDPDPEREKIYHVKLYTKVQPEPVCTGCTDLQGNAADNAPYCPDDATGPNRVKFVEANECVKYRCEDGIATMQEPCDVYQNRWWDSCKGSIVGCVIQGGGGVGGGNEQVQGNVETAKYWNGYAFEFDCPNGGVWAYNNSSDSDEAGRGGDWVQLTKAEEELTFSKCAYPNPLGPLGGNWIPTFVDLVKIHPCCAKAEAIYECDPETPNCQTTFEVFYERGDSSDLLDRLKLQVKALENFLEQIVAVLEELERIRLLKRGEISDYEEALTELLDDRTPEEIQEVIDQYEVLIEQAEADVVRLEGEIEEAQEDLDEAQERLDEILDEQQELIDERDAIVEERDAMQFEYDTLIINGDNAKAAYEQKSGELTRKEKAITNQENLMVEQGCSCPWVDGRDEETGKLTGQREQDCPLDGEGNEIPPEFGDTVYCFDQYTILETLTNEKEILKGEAEELEQTYQDYYKQADDLKGGYRDEEGNYVDGIDDLNEDIDRIQGNINGKNNTISVRRKAVDDAQAEVDDLRQQQVTAQNDIIRYTEEIKRLEEKLELADEDKTEQIEALEDAIEKADDVVAQIDELIGLVEEDQDAVEQAILEKELKIEELERDLGVPSKPEASSRPADGKTIEQIQEEMAEVVKEDEKRAGDTWFPE